MQMPNPHSFAVCRACPSLVEVTLSCPYAALEPTVGLTVGEMNGKHGQFTSDLNDTSIGTTCHLDKRLNGWLFGFISVLWLEHQRREHQGHCDNWALLILGAGSDFFSPCKANSGLINFLLLDK